MAGMTMVMFDKWTTLTAAAGQVVTYRSDWFDVTGYSQTTFTMLAQNLSGGAAAIKFQAEQSSDLDSDGTAGALVPLVPGTQMNSQVTMTARYVRAMLQLTAAAGADAAATVWVKAVSREAM